MAIINKVLETHSAHILEFSDFLDSRYQAMMRELCKQPSDIEGTVSGVFMHASPSEKAFSPRRAQAPRPSRSILVI